MMFNSTFFYGMVCSEPTWVQKRDRDDELHFMVSAVDKEKDRNRNPNDPYEYVKIPIIITNVKFAESLMKYKGLAEFSKVTIEGSITGIAGSFGAPGIAVAARNVRVEGKEKEKEADQPPINPARQALAYGRTRSE